jgi:Pyridoxamine 5'-phosphate oxidase
MGKRYTEIPSKLKRFIEDQKIFFVGTAAADGRVNISPKGMDSLRVIDANHVVWLNVTGSGNETSAHVQENPRMTIMFAALEGPPMILRIYGNAKVIHKNDPDWQNKISLFRPLPGARQIFELAVDLVQTSCGMGVPFYDYVGEREQLNEWARNKGDEGIKEYWKEKNQESIDGKPSFILERNS